MSKNVKKDLTDLIANCKYACLTSSDNAESEVEAFFYGILCEENEDHLIRVLESGIKPNQFECVYSLIMNIKDGLNINNILKETKAVLLKDQVTDIELKNELQRRGWNIKAEKTIVL